MEKGLLPLGEERLGEEVLKILCQAFLVVQVATHSWGKTNRQSVRPPVIIGRNALLNRQANRQEPHEP